MDDKPLTINWEHLNEHLVIARVGRDGPTAAECKFIINRDLWKWKLLNIEVEVFGYAEGERDACHIAGKALEYMLRER